MAIKIMIALLMGVVSATGLVAAPGRLRLVRELLPYSTAVHPGPFTGVKSSHLNGLLPHGPIGYSGKPIEYSKPQYKFDYAVSDDYTGSHFGHAEERDGYVTKGKYFVHLPDGRIQTVTYYADKTGYHPTITYEGKAHYPSYGAAPYVKPAYKAPVGKYGTPTPAYF
ncbi:cuticle protein 7 [Cherax quadricarinatus]|uniref:cuticle protein 7 n=1 Tax=Cherax quadricarinatus TaxID=27406 RepID=UPI00387E34BD